MKKRSCLNFIKSDAEASKISKRTVEDILSKTKLGRYASLKLKKHRDSEGLFMAEGTKCVGELLPAFRAESLVCTRGWLDSEAGRRLASLVGNVFVADARAMQRLSSMSTAPEVIAVLHKPEPAPLPSPLNPNLYLALDGVQDPGNLGTIIRTADWFGIPAIFCSRETVDVWNAKTVQATMGSLARVRVIYCDLCELFDANTNLPIYGTLLDGEDIYRTDLSAEGIIVMGNEGKGLSPQVRERVDRKLLLPPYPAEQEHAESLNVAVATALVTAEFRRRVEINSK